MANSRNPIARERSLRYIAESVNLSTIRDGGYFVEILAWLSILGDRGVYPRRAVAYP
jgi:hypothetical protein